MGFKPGAMVVVQHYPDTRSELVEITMLSPTYPPRLLQQQSLMVGQYTGVPTRGLYVYNSNPKNPAAGFLKARFATNGLMDPTVGVYRIGALAKALAGVQNEHALEGIIVNFEGVQPTARTLRSFVSEDVTLRGVPVANPLGVEYRVRFLTQSADKYAIPDEATVKAKAQAAPKSTDNRTSLSIIALLAVASVAAGCLVYFLVLGSGKSSAPKR